MREAETDAGLEMGTGREPRLRGTKKSSSSSMGLEEAVGCGAEVVGIVELLITHGWLQSCRLFGREDTVPPHWSQQSQRCHRDVSLLHAPTAPSCPHPREQKTRQPRKRRILDSVSAPLLHDNSSTASLLPLDRQQTPHPQSPARQCSDPRRRRLLPRHRRPPPPPTPNASLLSEHHSSSSRTRSRPLTRASLIFSAS